MRPSIPIMTLVALLALTGMALANIPDCTQSSIDTPARLGRSPKNVEVANATFQYTFKLTVRNSAGTPLANWPANDVTLSVLAPCQNPFALVNPNGPSDANGKFTWGPASLDRPGGSCTGAGVVAVRIISVPCNYVLNAVTSPDEDGDNAIALADLSILQQSFFNQNNPHQGDLNFDGSISLGDLSFLQVHFNAP
jgi:hypothetical protein